MDNLYKFLHERHENISEAEFKKAIECFNENEYMMFSEGVRNFAKTENRKKGMRLLREKYGFSKFEQKAILRAVNYVENNESDRMKEPFNNANKCVYYTARAVLFPFIVVGNITHFLIGGRTIIIIHA